MNLGIVTIYIALMATLFSAWHYVKTSNIIKSNYSKNQNYLHKLSSHMKFARQGFYTMSIMVGVASLYLLYLILSHKFQVDYVYRYSSLDLSFGYLLSAFWAGQEGSFLFWSLLISVSGLFLIKSAGKLESHSMILLNIIQGFFLLILIKASPFKLLPQIPIDGAGLNPLLQNPWMIIHPPILFIGYAAITIPFVLSLAALFRSDYKDLADTVFPWVLFSSITLGAGIIIGAFWAYGVLGWGGYWGWDPVENSSLIPWLTILALLHGLIIQKRSGALLKTNIVLAIVSFILVIYATFLTRSGVLADFSVHSFQNLGINSYLIAFMVGLLSLGLYLVYTRYKKMPWAKIDSSFPNRENALIASIYVLSASAFLILIGTSSPIITGLFANPAQVDLSFYNKVNYPIAIAISLLLGVTPFLLWVEKDLVSIIKRLIPSVVLTLLTTGSAYLFDIIKDDQVLFISASAFAFWSNGIVLVKNSKISLKNIGASLAHLGVGLMFIAIIVSGTKNDKQTAVLSLNNPNQALGYELVYTGMTKVKNGKNIANINVSDGIKSYLAKPRLYFSKSNKSWMREPDISSSLTQDIYISPIQFSEAQNFSDAISLELNKGEQKKLAEYDVRFTGFELDNHDTNTGMKVAANLEISKDDKSVQLKPMIQFTAGKKESFPVYLTHEQLYTKDSLVVTLEGINADTKSILLNISGSTTNNQHKGSMTDSIVIEISHKPLMSILWLGTILMIIGSIVSLHKRIQMNGRL